MASVPTRPVIARSYRWLLELIERKLSTYVPWVNPSWYQLIGLLLSAAALFISSDFWLVLIVSVVLLLDWLDGAAARYLKVASRQGWMLDVTIDRLSEVFLFIPLLGLSWGWLWLSLALLNIGLSQYSVVSGKHLILPLRFFYLLFLLYRMVG